MALLNEHQFEILPAEEAAEGFVFGIGADISIDGEGFDPASATWMTQDTQNSRRGNKNFGRDVLSNSIWTWAGFVDGEDVPTAMQISSAFSKAWRPEALMRTPGAQTCIRYRLADRYRRIYGRPRRLDLPLTNRILAGFRETTFDFEKVDAYTYDDSPEMVSIPFSVGGESSGGFIFPVVMPYNTLPSDNTDELQVHVGGDARTYPVVRFNGPWTNPSLETDDWKLELTGGISEGDYIEVDLRPWKQTILNQSGLSRPERLASRRTWFEDMYFEPDTYPMLRLGGSSSGGASCDISWRAAYYDV